MLTYFRTLFFGLIFLTVTNAFAVGFNHETILHFHNCTGQPITISWDGYNLNFDTEADPFRLNSGKFTVEENEKNQLLKALWAYFNPSPNGMLTCKVNGPNFNGSFSVKLTGVLPEGRLVYFENTDGITFAKTHIEFANVTAINTVHIGC